MARHLLRSRVLIFAALALVAGCPATCQTKRDYKAQETIKVQVGTAEVQETNQKSGKKIRRTHLRKDGTPWLIEDDLSWLTNVSKAWKYGHSNTETERKVVEKVETRPWWYWPMRVATVATILTILAYLLYRRIKR